MITYLLIHLLLTQVYTSGAFYTVIVIALFLHILWDTGPHPLILLHCRPQNSGDNNNNNKKKNGNIVPLLMGAARTTESFTSINKSGFIGLPNVENFSFS